MESIIVALAAGAAALLFASVHPTLRVLLLAAGFAAAFAIDLRAARAGLAPPWLLRLRKPLTAVTLAALAVVAVAAA